MFRYAVRVKNAAGTTCWLTPLASNGIRHLGIEKEREIFATYADAHEAIEEMPPTLLTVLEFDIVKVSEQIAR